MLTPEITTERDEWKAMTGLLLSELAWASGYLVGKEEFSRKAERIDHCIERGLALMTKYESKSDPV